MTTIFVVGVARYRRDGGGDPGERHGESSTSDP
jgi:hypothetical protein